MTLSSNLSIGFGFFLRDHHYIWCSNVLNYKRECTWVLLLLDIYIVESFLIKLFFLFFCVFVCMCLCACLSVYSEETGWSSCHGDAASKECWRWRGRWEREKESISPKEREVCAAREADQTGCPDWLCRYSNCLTDTSIKCKGSNQEVLSH